jgi:hypothetical protein
MYNLTVAIAHTFFVGEEQWLVHNAKKNCYDAWREKLGLGSDTPNNQKLFELRHMTVDEFLSKFRAGSIRREMPAEALTMTVEEVLKIKIIKGKRVRKLITDARDKFLK